jgi:hypothetical protein
MTTYEVPLDANPQEFSINLSGVVYSLIVQWNRIAQSWQLDIADANNIPILNSIPLVTGVDLLAQFKHLNFGGALTVTTDGNATAIPTFDNLGSTSHLYFTV